MKKSNSTFKQLNKKQRLQYIWDYYKIHIMATVAIICIIISIARTALSSKEINLYMAFVNFAPTEVQVKELTEAPNLKISTYSNLLITEDPDSDALEYAYASSMKLMAAINDDKLDLLVTDSFGIDMANSNEYLTNVDTYIRSIDSSLADSLTEHYIYDDNNQPYAIDLSFTPFFKKANFSDKIYLGIIADEDKGNEEIQWIKYITSL